MDWGYRAADVPCQLQAAVQRFTDSNYTVRGIAKPLEEGNVHLFDGSLNMQEVTLGSWCHGSYACCQARSETNDNLKKAT